MRQFVIICLVVAGLIGIWFYHQQENKQSEFIRRVSVNMARNTDSCMLLGCPRDSFDRDYSVTVFYRSALGAIVGAQAYICHTCFESLGRQLSDTHAQTVLAHWVEMSLEFDIKPLKTDEFDPIVAAREAGIKTASLDPDTVEEPEIYLAK